MDATTATSTPTITTPDGTTVVAYGTYGSVRGYGPLRATQSEAERDLDDDITGCRGQGGYSDREVVAVDADGCCWEDDDGEIGAWVAGPGGHRAAHYSAADLAAV